MSLQDRSEVESEFFLWVDEQLANVKGQVDDRLFQSTLGMGGGKGLAGMLFMGSMGTVIFFGLSLAAAYWFGTGGSPLG